MISNHALHGFFTSYAQNICHNVEKGRPENFSMHVETVACLRLKER